MPYLTYQIHGVMRLVFITIMNFNLEPVCTKDIREALLIYRQKH